MSIRKLNVIIIVLLLAQLACIFHTPTVAGWQMQKSSNSYKQQFNDNENDDQNEDFSQLAESLAGSVAAAAVNGQAAGNPQCEPINFKLCSSMRYNFTRMTNFFGDTSQIEAESRANQYEHLARTQCSRHLLAYLCELLAPMCIENDSQKKFEIYPCRPFCRQVRQDCAKEILEMTTRYRLGQIAAAFDCDKLAYESNGGSGDLRGPCHEIPVESPSPSYSPPPTNRLQQQQPPRQQLNINNNNGADSYKPYLERELEKNVPPFIDTSPLDPRAIRPSNPVVPDGGERKSPPQQTPTSSQPASPAQASGSSSVSAQIQSFGHQLALGLMSYSNLLSVLTLICLLFVVNAKRLKRFKCYLTRRSSSSSSSNRSSSSSSSSSNDSRRKLAAVPALGQARKLAAMSPSSSSRSLVLVASADGKRGQPKHKLVHANELAAGSLEPSKRLLQAGLDRRTLINVNGTLERPSQHQSNAAARYHLMQSIGAMAGDNSSKHQYDYIQVLNNRGSGALSDFEQRSTGYLNNNNNNQHQQASGGNNFRSMANPSRPQLSNTNEPQTYSNILLSSPSHQVLLFGDGNTTTTDQQQQQPPSNRSHFMTANSLNSPYADPTFGAGSMSSNRPVMHHNLMNGSGGSDSASSIQHQQLMVEHQRSFQRRPSGSGSSSARFKRSANTTTTTGQPIGSSYVSSGGASSASSSAGSTTSSFSPPESSSGNLLLANQFVQSSPRANGGPRGGPI